MGLRPRTPDRVMRFGVELAALLNIELLGLFLDDIALRDFAAIPFAREFRPLGGGWHPIDTDRLTQELDLIVRATERAFLDAAKGLTVRSQFEIVRGAAADAIRAISDANDIVLIVEPDSAAERSTHQFLTLIESAFLSAAAVMLVPARIAPAGGPIVAIAFRENDPSIYAAAAIATAAKADLIIVDAYKPTTHAQSELELATATGLKVQHLAAEKPWPMLSPGPWPVLRHLRARLIVITRGDDDHQIAPIMVSAQRTPVLIVEPKSPQA